MFTFINDITETNDIFINYYENYIHKCYATFYCQRSMKLYLQ